jgi:hypothetical protein
MKALKNILFYTCLMFALVGYVSCEFSDSILSSGINLEILDTQNESDSREYEERTYTKEYAPGSSPELKRYYSSKQKQYYIQFLFISFEYKPFVWIPPKHA